MDEEDEAPAAKSAKDKPAKSAPNQMKASKATKAANQRVESIFDSPEPIKSTRGKPKKGNHVHIQFNLVIFLIVRFLK